MVDHTQLRRNYSIGALNEDEVAAHPMDQFGDWFDTAVSSKLLEPNAMTLATVRSDGRPAARMVLLKGFDVRGFVFYTSYAGCKAAEIAANPSGCLVFWWDRCERQVRVEGTISRVAAATSDAYFETRSRGSQISVWSSRQSEVVPDRASVERAVEEVTRRFDGEAITRPDSWGGYRLEPNAVEFWQGRENRLHDRILYQFTADETWSISRLSP